MIYMRYCKFGEMKINQKYILLVVVLTICLFVSSDIAAQCPMCKMSAESNLKAGGTAGKGLNNGILYMLTLPYILVGSLGYLWWRNRRRLSDDLYDPMYSDN